MTDQKTLLIIDDEPSIRESLSSFFEDEGYTVFTAEDGEHGVDLFSVTDIDVVITDLRMPGKDGFYVMKTIHETSPDTPVLVVSGAGESEDVIRALRMGAKDYITKPIPSLEMIEHAVNDAFESHRLIKENKQYRKALEKSEYHYRTITENIAEGVFTLDENDAITYVNDAFSSIVGYTKTDLISKPIRELAPKESYQVLKNQDMAREKKKVRRFEILLINQSGEKVHVELVCNPLFSGVGQYRGVIAVARDITELTQLRQKFKKFLDQSKTSDKSVIPICASCKNIRETKDKWISVEEHFMDTVFSHSICPDCCEKLYPQFDFSELKSSKKST